MLQLWELQVLQLEPPEEALRALKVEAPTAKTDIRRRSFFAPHLGQGLPLPFSPMRQSSSKMWVHFSHLNS